MLKTLLTPFAPSTQKPTPSVAAMLVSSHDINFVMGFIKEEEIFSTSPSPSPGPINNGHDNNNVRHANMPPNQTKRIESIDCYICFFFFSSFAFSLCVRFYYYSCQEHRIETKLLLLQLTSLDWNWKSLSAILPVFVRQSFIHFRYM